ncbi:FAD-dependent oxidoreductase [Solirubrobacter soli]|uniref:FAD-dependent oxidoreductase n=1 Tax=Solirubrobacter soli TaxID=363832 RepID=UPI0012FC9E64|nr:FAD-dependent oxidoreductase [Solirubrobacter soli]
MAAITFPNYTQIPSRLSLTAWRAIRAVVWIGALIIAGLLIAVPDTGLQVFWKAVIPTLPVLFMVAPGVWRNICPLATSNQTPRLLGITKGLNPPAWLKEYGYVIAVGGFIGFVMLRKVGLDDSGPLTALLLLGAMAGAFAGGMVLKGKSGWCSTVCPLLPVQRIYGQTPFALVGNNHCQPCVGCAKSCYDFNPRAAYLADLNDADGYWSGYRKFFVGAFPGLILGFFETAEGDIPGMLLYMAVSTALFALAITFVKVSTHTITSTFGAIAFSIFYFEGAASYEPATWGIRAVALALAAVWLVRTWRKEKPFLAQAAAPVVAVNNAASRSIANNRALKSGAPEVHFVDDDKTVLAKEGLSLLEIAESNGLTIESGCRMGICGADPVAVKDGMDCLSGISDDERATLERLGYAPNTRMACCARVQGPVSVALKPDKAATPSISKVAGFSYDKSVANVVVIGNGIAGVTAVDHIRRRHPVTQIDLIAEEPHHLYNRMGIARLVYGKSAMQGLYLNPDAWYGEREIEVWLNTRALQIDRANRQVHLGTGEKLPYDKLILAMGSRAFVPPIEGYGLAGTGVLRKADDAIRVRTFAQRHAAKRATVAGGGLLGLEAAYALHQLGVRATVLERSDRLLKRQLDARAAELLQRYLEGLGLEIITSAETRAVFGQGRLDSLELVDGRRLDTEILLVAAGIQPNAELARAAGLATNRGVLVNARMQTGDPHILAAGDVAEFEGQVPGLWPVSVAQAEVAADVAVGGSKLYDPVVPVTILKVVGIELTSIGRFEAAGSHEEEIALEDASGRYRKLVVADGRIVGAILLGFSKEVAAVRTAITRGFDVTHVLPTLRQGRWDVLTGMSGEMPLAPAVPA